MPNQDAKEMEHASLIDASRYRTAVVDELTDGPSIPSKISERTGLGISHVSRAIQELRDGGVVELTVPESTKKGRIYALTDSGKQAAKVAEKL